MDKLDVRILRELIDVPAASPASSDIRKSLRAVAKNLNVSESSIRERVTRLRTSGFLKGWTPFLNPNIFGQRASFIWLEVEPNSKQGLTAKLQLMPGTAALLNFHGGFVGMLVFYDSPESFKRELELIQRVSEADSLAYSELRFPPSRVGLSRTDYRIVRNLLESPESSYKQTAFALSLSTRTVRRRIETLTKSMALFATPAMDPSKLEGAILANLVVTYDTPQSKFQVDSAIRSKFGDVLLSSQMGMVDRGAFFFCISNISRSKEILAWTRLQPGVKASRVDLVEEIVQRFDWLRELLDRALEDGSSMQGKKMSQPSSSRSQN